MSLPTNVKLSVQGHSRPGDTSHSIPKQAMIVRMTAETLDALQANPRMEFTFGPEPGISIGDAFFPMRPAEENYPHDLYLRASSAAKPMAPLKLYANITGKFTVKKDLATIQNQIQTTTFAAETKKKNRVVTMLPGPPPGVSSSQTTKKGKSSGKAQSATSAFLKPNPQPRPSTSTSARAPSPLPPATPSPLRTAVVKALALKERSFDELVRLVENDGEKGKRKLVELLNQIAEHPKGAKASSQWCLRPATWVEVRPYEWNDLTDPERIQVARTARLTFSNLNIPESDPVWAHVQYRQSAESSMLASGSASSKAAAKSEVPKRGVSSKEAKERKMKPKPDPKAETSMRDERKPAPRPSASKDKDVDRPGPSSATAAAPRKVPGSGFRISKVPSPDQAPPAPLPPASGQASRGRPVDVRMNREPPRPSVPAKPAPPILPPAPVQEKKPAAARIKKIKDVSQVKDLAPVIEYRERERGEITGKDSLKRKKPSQDIDDSDTLPNAVPKRRKTEGMVPTSTPRDLSLPKKPETSLSAPRPIPKTKREPSPLPSGRPQQKAKSDPSSHPAPRPSLPPRPTAGSSSSSHHAHAESHSGSKSSAQNHRTSLSLAKRRERRSPIYTSSEDEGAIRDEPIPLPTPPATTVHPPNRARASQSSNPTRPLPTDRTGLRKKYNATYLKYLASYQQLFAQQSKLESLLTSRDGSTISDSDGDVEVLSPEDTMKLKADHKRYEKELETIRAMFERGESKSD
ncbi:hypothetical protein DFH08DRAFT_1080544 [Mycena albidolilacea]|uniref:RNA polymerase II elongation factor ELL N-terminal domain-containing protein n=1 Tax=Mycena albidolilacea TaxID=1033008 RepID=A0AAD7A0N4_9AGAR|nr:hypothetical protein DFH08DRAFT_1080544 [Mycena albidolilacea]